MLITYDLLLPMIHNQASEAVEEFLRLIVVENEIDVASVMVPVPSHNYSALSQYTWVYLRDDRPRFPKTHMAELRA